METELSFGEKAVGLTFNPSNDPTVQKLKGLYAEIIDILNAIQKEDCEKMSADIKREKGRLANVAIKEAQGAQMWAVKAATWKD